MTKRWYVVHAYSGFEKSVARALEDRIRRAGMQDKFGKILVPTEEVVEMKSGQKSISERKFFPGYVLVEMEMDDEAWHLVKNTAKVTGFLGHNGKPQAISERDAARYFGHREIVATTVKKHVAVDFEIGDSVKVLDGPFNSFTGIVEELDFDKNRVKVAVSIFGRATPVELEYAQVEKA